jgi:hypothetical protein
MIYMSTEIMGEVDPFHFLLELGQYKYTRKYISERVSIVLLLNTTFLTVKAAAVDSGVQYRKWQALKIFADAALTTEYKSALEAGKNDFQLTSSNIEAMYKFLSSTSTAEPSSNCILYHYLFADYELTEFEFLKKKGNGISREWTAGEINGEKRLLLDTYIMEYNTIGEKWRVLTEKATTLLEKVVQKDFPEELSLAVEELTCVQDSTLEKIKVIETKKSTDKVIMELEVVAPTEENVVTKLVHIPYKGFVLKQPTSTGKYVRKIGGTNTLWNLECTDNGVLNEDSPLCTLEEIDTPCTQALGRNDLDSALWVCTFTKDKNPVHISRIQDEGVLITTTEYSIADGTKVIYTQPPIVIYSNQLITLTKSSEEITFPPRVNFTTQKVIPSLLTAVQQTLVRTRGSISDFWDHIDYTEYANYLSWGLQFLTLPLPLIGLILTCRHRRLINKAKKKIKKKDNRKGRSERNDLLLQRLDM